MCVRAYGVGRVVGMGGIARAMGCHKVLCQWLYERQGEPRIPIPEYDEETHPLQVFEDTHVEVNVYRWVVFVLWPQHYPQAWQWYRILQKTYPSRIPSIRTLSNELWHHVRRRSR